MRKFKIERQDARIDVSLPVTITAVDINGQALEQEVRTINVSRRGALLRGIQGRIPLGAHVSIARSHKVEKFLAVWIGQENTAGAGQIGVSALNPTTAFWNDVIEARTEQAKAEEEHSNEGLGKAKGTAAGA